jgi:hypothetical protein
VTIGFECALVRRATRKGVKTPSPKYSRCGEKKTYRRLKPGTYVLYVRGIGPVGPQDRPVIYRFKIS